MTTPMFNATIGLKGRYKLVRRKGIQQPDGSWLPGEVLSESAWCPNIVTQVGIDYFLNAPGSNSNLFVSAVVGAGNTAPAIGQTALVSFIGGTYVTQAHTLTRNYTTVPYYLKWSYTFRFSPGQATGNVAEVGMCFTQNATTTPNSSTPVCSRALVVDGVGAPTTVSIAADEYLDMTWELFMYPGTATGSFNMTIDGVSTAFNYETRPLRIDGGTLNSGTSQGGWTSGAFNAGSWSGMVRWAPAGGGGYTNRCTWMGNGTLSTGPTTQPSLAGSDANCNSTHAWNTFTPGVGYRDATFTWGLTQGNTVVNFFGFQYGAGAFQMSISPSFTKVSTKTFSITMRLSIANVP